ncbi:unnamed protein product, partial [Rotaria magnacalcarata]
ATKKLWNNGRLLRRGVSRAAEPPQQPSFLQCQPPPPPNCW